MRRRPSSGAAGDAEKTLVWEKDCGGVGREHADEAAMLVGQKRGDRKR